MCVLTGQRSNTLTAAVLRHPADGGRQSIDVEVLPVELCALLFPEIPPAAGTRIRVTRAELHSAADTKTPSVPRPENDKEFCAITTCVFDQPIMRVF